MVDWWWVGCRGGGAVLVAAGWAGGTVSWASRRDVNYSCVFNVGWKTFEKFPRSFRSVRSDFSANLVLFVSLFKSYRPTLVLFVGRFQRFNLQIIMRNIRGSTYVRVPK